MDRNILEVIRWRKKVVKLSAVAFIGAISVFGVPHAVSAMAKSPCVMEEIHPVKRKHSDIYRQDTKRVKRSRVQDTEVENLEGDTVYDEDDSYGKRCYDDARKSLEDKARDDADAQYRLGLRYLNLRNYEEAFLWLGKAVRRGHKEARKLLNKDKEFQYRLGLRYLNSQNYEEAFLWLGKAMRRGHEEARKSLEDKAHDNKEAQFHLGYSYLHKCDDKNTFFWLGKAMRRGHKEARKLLEKEAADGNEEAQFHLGYSYLHKCDDKNAFLWLGKAMRQDHEGARKLLKDKADVENNVEAQYKLGLCYLSLNKSDEALPWFQKAANQGHDKAKNFFSNLIDIQIKKTILEDKLKIATEYLKQQPGCLRLSGKIAVVGDIHGDDQALCEIIKNLSGRLKKKEIDGVLFLGDFLDRGNSTDTLSALLEFFNANEGKVFILRGNHEGGGCGSDAAADDEPVFQLFQMRCDNPIDEFKENLPHAAIINNDTLAVHGGIPWFDKSQIKSIDIQQFDDKDLKEYYVNFNIEKCLSDFFTKETDKKGKNAETAVWCATWSDFDPECVDVIPNEKRDCFNSCIFGLSHLKSFFDKVNKEYNYQLKYLVRGHTHPYGPFDQSKDEETVSVTTVISTPKLMKAYEKPACGAVALVEKGKAPTKLFEVKC